MVTERSNIMMETSMDSSRIDHDNDKYPFCLVWTPIPILTWLFPIIGHMGIAYSNGTIRDFSGPYHVSEGNFAFGKPTKYFELDPSECKNGVGGWDAGVLEASTIYQRRMHNLLCDNCHSHVATALNIMQYKSSSNWNMVKVALMFSYGAKYVSLWSLAKTWLPFLIIVGTILSFVCIKM